MSLIRNLISGTIIAAGLTAITPSALAESQVEPLYFKRIFPNGELHSLYYGTGPHNGFKWDFVEHIRVCVFSEATEITAASYNTESMTWVEGSRNGVKEIILGGIEELKEYITEQFMKCERMI